MTTTPTPGAASELPIDEDNCPHEWERQNGAYGTDPTYLCICCGKVRTAESEADEQWL